MTGRVTVMDLAAEAGVSRATVSLVLRQSPRIKEETKGRVRAAIKKLGYVYNRIATICDGVRRRWWRW